MLLRAAENRGYHARKSRRPLIKKKQRERSMIYVVATSQVKPESRDAFIKGAKECIAATRKEKGCISYESHASINDPNLFVVVERWETREDLNAHGRAPHMKVWREYSAPLKVSPTVIEIISDGKVEKL
jgi:quinol monooxygenase YgiN